MKTALCAAILLSLPISAAEVTRVGPYAFHSSLWINLHETLMHCASAETPCDLTTLNPEERAAWSAAVETYRRTGTGNITFRRAMAVTHDVLTQVGDDETASGVREPLGPALRQAAPIYRRHFWPDHDRGNRFWIGYTAAMVRDAGEELANGHARAYGLPWPEAVRVDAAAYGGRFDAYTMMGQLAGVHVTISSRSPSYWGFGALESVFHEASHALVNPMNGPVAEAIQKHAKSLDIEPPRDLWHAILFATTSELTRRTLATRGIDYKPFAAGMLTDVWPRYREPIEKFWIAYLDGRMTFDEAIGKIVEASSKTR